MDWFEFKSWISEYTGLDRDSLHIYAAVGIQLIMALFVRSGLANFIPWIVVSIAVLGNEYLDFSGASQSTIENGSFYEAAIHDIWNSMVLPTLFLMIARFWPGWLTGRRNETSKSLPETSEEIEN